MRVARKSRQAKSISAAKSNGFSAVGIAEAPTELESGHVPAAWSGWNHPRGIQRVPTHAIAVPNERRAYTRAALRLPLRIVRIAGRRETQSRPFMTIDISSSGVFTHCPFEIDPGTPVHLEVELVRRQSGQGTVKLVSEAHVVRATAAGKAGWFALAFSFDEITFERDDLLAPAFAGS
jgi:hypothetical protein